jgi:hypothetical protein
MDDVRYDHRHLEVACELEGAEAGARAEEWRVLRDRAGLGSEPIPTGVRMWLRPEARTTAEDLARREGICCGFLDIVLATEEDRVRLDLTSPTPDAQPIIACLAGADPDCALECC